MKNNKIRLPQSSGGLTRFSESSHSFLEFSPNSVVTIIVAVVIIISLMKTFLA